ncbi:AZOBR_p60025 family cell surface glycopolymer formation protein [Chloroflexota bacterium]
MKSSKKSFPPNKFWKYYGPTLVVFIVATAFALLVLATNQGDPMAFVRLGTRFSQGDPNGTTGYDGQFVYQIALNPVGAGPYIDIPAYRYQRILYPLTARLVSLGQPEIIPWVLIGLNIIALAGGTHVMDLILARKRLSRWYAVTVGLFAGQLVSLRFAVNEPFSLTFALLAIYAFETERPRPGAILLALSVLSKETALAFAGGYLLYFFIKKQWRLLIETGLISLAPFLLLQAILWFAFGEIALRSGGEGATAFSFIPFGSLVAFGLNDPETFTAVLLMLGPLILLPTLALMVSLSRYFWRKELAPVAIILALHVIMIATLPYSTYVDLPGILRLSSGLVVATIAFAAITRSRRMLNYSLLWNASLVYLRFFV